MKTAGLAAVGCGIVLLVLALRVALDLVIAAGLAWFLHAVVPTIPQTPAFAILVVALIFLGGGRAASDRSRT